MKYTLACFLLPLSAATVAAPGPEDAIRSIYEAHQPWVNKQLDFANRVQLSKYFDAELVDLFIRNEKCEEQTGAICALDWDPLLCAQDYLVEDPTVDVQVSFERPYTHKATLKSMKGDHVLFLMRETKAGWRVADMKCPESSSLKAFLSAVPK